MRDIKMETQRVRPHINTAPGLAQIHRHANNVNIDSRYKHKYNTLNDLGTVLRIMQHN